MARNIDLNSNRAWTASTSVWASQVGRTAKRPSAPKERVMRRAIGCALDVQFATREESKLLRGLRPSAGVGEVIAVKDPEWAEDAGGVCASCVDVVEFVAGVVVGRWPGIASQREGGKKRGRERAATTDHSFSLARFNPCPLEAPTPACPFRPLRPPPTPSSSPNHRLPSPAFLTHFQPLLSYIIRYVFAASNALKWALLPATG